LKKGRQDQFENCPGFHEEHLMSGNRDRKRTSSRFLPYKQELVERAREMRKNPTPAERKLWYEFLRTFKYRVMHQRPIDNFIVDFYCAELKLVIEVDGDSHYTQASLKNDARRTAILEGYGLRVLRFTNRDVLDNFEAVCDAIAGIPPTPLIKGGSLPGDE
jgi:very-short-patch-repair endonuclease